MKPTEEPQMDDAQSANEPKLKFLVGALGIVVVAWALSGLLIYLMHSTKDERGAFGDMFGAINALFSGCAFAVLIYTLFLQRHELKLQRLELKLTRDALYAQQKEMASQADTLKLQQFENTFFQLMRLHGEIVQAIDLVRTSTGGQRTATHGRDCFSTFLQRLQRAYVTVKARGQSDELEMVKEAYRVFYNDNASNLGHYFRHLYHIIKFIDENPNVDRRRYRSFLRAQLSSDELTLLFYNCLSHHGAKAKPLVEKYSMLKNMPPDGPFELEHADYFEKRAFDGTGPVED